MQHAAVQWEQEKDLGRVLDWGLVQGLVLVTGLAVLAVLAMGSAPLKDQTLMQELEAGSVLVLGLSLEYQLGTVPVMGTDVALALEPAMG